ncbi:MAG TPA: hypothetical protein VGK73_00405 [Polyangiaceae bacterium]
MADRIRAGARLVVVLGLASACGKLDQECRAVTTRANAFIEEAGRLRPKPDASPADTAREALATAARYERLAADLRAIPIESSKLQPEVASYRTLAERSAASLRAVAQALTDGDFDTARRKRVELDRAARGEGPLVARINEVCGLSPAPAASGR